MSISSEILRIATNVNNAKDAIVQKGVVVPSSATSDDLASLILQIPTGGEDIFMVHLAWDGTSWTSDTGYYDIVRAIFGEDVMLGKFVIGQSKVGGTPTGVLVYAKARMDGERSAYSTSMFSGAMIELDHISKKACFVLAPSVSLWIDDEGHVSTN